jgi:hypothetical protein
MCYISTRSIISASPLPRRNLMSALQLIACLLSQLWGLLVGRLDTPPLRGCLTVQPNPSPHRAASKLPRISLSSPLQLSFLGLLVIFVLHPLKGCVIQKNHKPPKKLDNKPFLPNSRLLLPLAAGHPPLPVYKPPANFHKKAGPVRSKSGNDS